jgi:hypothetical protein
MIRSVQEQQAVAMLENMPAHAHVQIYQQRQKHNCDLLNIYNLKFTNMTHAEQRAYLRARAFPETTLDRLTTGEKLNTVSKYNPATSGAKLQSKPESKSGHQIQLHNQGRDNLAHTISLYSRVTVETEPTSAEMREVDANGEVVSLKRPDIAVHFADKTLIGDITVVQTKNANLTKNVEKERDIIYNKWTHRFLTVDTVLAPTAKCVDTRMNLRANEKTKKYQFLFSDGDEDVKRFFFPIVVTTDGTLHKSAYDFINCVTSQTNLLQDADAADKIAVSLKSKILGYVTSRYIKKLYPVKAVNSYVIPVRGGVSRQVC